MGPEPELIDLPHPLALSRAAFDADGTGEDVVASPVELDVVPASPEDVSSDEGDSAERREHGCGLFDWGMLVLPTEPVAEKSEADDDPGDDGEADAEHLNPLGNTVNRTRNNSIKNVILQLFESFCPYRS